MALGGRGSHTKALDGVDMSAHEERTVSAWEINFMVAHSPHRHSRAGEHFGASRSSRDPEIMSHRSPSDRLSGRTKERCHSHPVHAAVRVGSAEVPNSSAYGVYKIGGDQVTTNSYMTRQGDPARYACAYVPLQNRALRTSATGTSEQRGNVEQILRSTHIVTWREYEALRNEMRREFRTKDDELKDTVDEIKETLDATNITTMMKILSLKMTHTMLVVRLMVIVRVVGLHLAVMVVGKMKKMDWLNHSWLKKQRLKDVLRELGVYTAPSTRGTVARSVPYSTPPSKPVSNVSNAKKSESAASTSGSSVSTTRNRDMLCHTCGGKGHFKRDCPNRKVMFINEDNEYETGDDVDPNAPDDDDYDTDGEDAYPSNARTIVVSQRALNVLPSASTQRCNLFQTKALVGPDKACKVIIDGGSCRNLASKELCTKLKLKYLPHPHPYYIQWLSDSGEMKVNHMVRVEFEIGPGDMHRTRRGALDVKTDIKKAVKLDMELDMKISHGRAREEREECERRRRSPGGRTARHLDVYQEKFKRAVVLVEADEDEGATGDQEVAVAEWTRTASPVSCKWVKPQGPPKWFDFDVTKAEQIFDLLLNEKLKYPKATRSPRCGS
ncbi:hypothetical protein QYE76_068633 [Lolium multiflorum]|uniref:CCHC-type domain-containing protein n=1 Tax=Lolium multiflorum TaxID=4521 RepID=A0AAD8SFV7_LOLMU|nr:hypothetical protein QYE76_068633 [Lolium multiflorum]